MSDIASTPEFDEDFPKEYVKENLGYKLVKDYFPDSKAQYVQFGDDQGVPEQIQEIFDTTAISGGYVQADPAKPTEFIGKDLAKSTKPIAKGADKHTSKPDFSSKPSKNESEKKKISIPLFTCISTSTSRSKSRTPFLRMWGLNIKSASINYFGLIPLLFSVLMLIITVCVWKTKHFYYGPFETRGGLPLFQTSIHTFYYVFFWISLLYSSTCFCFIDFFQPSLLTTIFLYVSICGISLFEMISICVSPSYKEGEVRYVFLLFEIAFAIMFFFVSDHLLRKRILFHDILIRLVYEVGCFFTYFMYVSIAARLSGYSSIMFAEFPWDSMSVYLILFVSMMFLYIMVVSNLSIGMCISHVIGYIIYSNSSVNREIFTQNAIIVFYFIHTVALGLMVTSFLTHKYIRRGIVRRDIGFLLLVGELLSIFAFSGPMFLDGITYRTQSSMHFNDVILFTNLSAGLGFGYYLSITVCIAIIVTLTVFHLFLYDDCDREDFFDFLNLAFFAGIAGGLIALHFNYLMMMKKMCDEGFNSMIHTFFAMVISHFINAFMGLCYLFASSGMMINFLYIFIRLSTYFYFVFFGSGHIVHYFSYLLDTPFIFFFILELFFNKQFQEGFFSAIFYTYSFSLRKKRIKYNWYWAVLFISLCSEIAYHAVFSILPIIFGIVVGIVMLILLIIDVCY